MPQTATGATALKEPPDAAPAQSSTHARPRTGGRHRVAPIRPSTHCPNVPAPLQGDPTNVRRLPSAPPRTHVVAQTPTVHPHRTCAPRMHERLEHTRPRMYPVGPLKQAFFHMAAVRARLWQQDRGQCTWYGIGRLRRRHGDRMSGRAERFFSYFAIFRGKRDTVNFKCVLIVYF